MRLKTASTGLGENIELPNYFLQPHLDCDSPSQTNSSRYLWQIAPYILGGHLVSPIEELNAPSSPFDT